MDTPRETVVAAVNRLTARWLHQQRDGAPAVLTGLGVWPLLVALQQGATGKGAAALAAVTAAAGDHLVPALREFHAILKESPSLHAALGVWAGHRLRLNPDWVAALPRGTTGRLSGDTTADRELLDAWASEHTGGLVRQFPVAVEEEADLVMASALGVRARWREPFRAEPQSFLAGPWSGNRTWQGLTRSGSDLSPLRVWDTAVTTLRVAGADDTDVVLVMGEEGRSPADVLLDGMDTLEASSGFTTAADLPVGRVAPGVEVRMVPSAQPDPEPVLRVTTVAFDVAADHDLLADASLFGLESTLNANTSPLTAVTVADDPPVVVSKAAQRAVARFSAVGFEAAAVTATAMVARAGIPVADRGMRRVVWAVFNRPFGYLAVHRPTGLVAVAGWVSEPAHWPDD